MGTKARFSLDLGYSIFNLQANLPSSVYLLSRDRHSSASEIPLSKELNRTGKSCNRKNSVRSEVCTDSQLCYVKSVNSNQAFNLAGQGMHFFYLKPET